MKNIVFIDGLFENGSNIETITSSSFAQKYHCDYFSYETKSILSISTLSKNFTTYSDTILKKTPIDAFVCFSFGSVVLAYSTIPKNIPIIFFGPTIPQGVKLSDFTTSHPDNSGLVVFDNMGDNEILHKIFVNDLDQLNGSEYGKLIHNPVYVVFHNSDSDTQKLYNQSFFDVIDSNNKEYVYLDIEHSITPETLSVIDTYLSKLFL